MHRSYPKSKPLRSEPYRRLVASLPCINCGVSGCSQAAHPNAGKGKGIKADDRLCFPLCCTRPGNTGCHYLHDQHRLLPKGERASREAQWARMTAESIYYAGLWPAGLERTLG